MRFIPPKIQSSYAPNELGKTIYQVVYELKPKIVIEFGVLHGYSLVCIAQALRDLGKGYAIGYDLWEDYSFNQGEIKSVEKTLRELELEDIVILKKSCLFDWLDKPDEFDLLHLDISNDGDILMKVISKLKEQLKRGSILMFEGGIHERDIIDWMILYNKKPIYPLKDIIGFRIINDKFPGLAIIDRKNKLKL